MTDGQTNSIFSLNETDRHFVELTSEFVSLSSNEATVEFDDHVSVRAAGRRPPPTDDRW